jgi:hypothetical protein
MIGPTRPNKTDAGNGSDGIGHFGDASISPSREPERKPEKQSNDCHDPELRTCHTNRVD